MNRGAIVFEERLRIPADVFSLDRFRDWSHSAEYPRSGRISYIDGEIEVEMSPEEIETHNKVKGCVFLGVSLLAQQKDLGEVLSDRSFLVNEAADLATEPDATFCGWGSLRSGKVRYAERKKGSRRFVEVVGSPDLTVEVVSDNSVRKDTVLLRESYYRAGIPEYWLLDARFETIDFKILERGDAEYVETAKDADGYRWSPVLGGGFLLTRDVNPVGGYSYKLLSR